MNRKSVLITGAAGFLGSYLVKGFLNEDADIYAVSRTSLDNPDFVYIEADLAKPDWTRLLPDQVDIVIHLAQSSHYKNPPEDSRDLLDINVISCYELLNWAKFNRVKQVVVASTGSVYKPSNKQLKESSPVELSSMYSVSKYASENIARQYSKYFSVSVIRPFTLYGGDQKKGVINTVFNKIKEHDHIKLAGNMGLVTTPIFIDDAVRYLIKLCEIKDSGFSIYNLGGNEIISLRNVVDELGKITGTEPKVEITDERPVYLMGDSNKLYRKTGIFPEVTFKDGLRRIISDNEN